MNVKCGPGLIFFACRTEPELQVQHGYRNGRYNVCYHLFSLFVHI